MKNSFFRLFTLMFALFAFVACSNDDDGDNLDPVESSTASNIHAPQTGGQGEPTGGAFTKFNFATGAVTTSDTDWDIAFRGTSVAVNGGEETGTADEPARNGDAGVAVVSGTLASITAADGLTFKQDASGTFAISGDDSWYTYNPTAHTITATPGKVFVFKTQDGHYAKVEFISYYKDAPSEIDPYTAESRYYTFNYVYNPNEGDTNLAD